MRRATSPIALLVAGVAVALPPAAASSRPATSPDQWLARSLAAATSASTVHVVAKGIPNGSGRMSWNMRLVAGKGGYGSMTLGTQRIDLVRIGRVAYFRAGAGFWRQYGGSAVAELLAGRWVKLPASTKGFASFIALTDISQFFTGILSSHAKLADGGEKTILGRHAVGVVDTSGGGTIWVAATGTPFPLELTPPHGSGVALFESWNTPEHIPAPLNPIDLAKLKK